VVEDKKVKVQLSDDSGNVETLWADPLGKDLYRLDNTPWYAYRVSCGDVIEARPDEPGVCKYRFYPTPAPSEPYAADDISSSCPVEGTSTGVMGGSSSTPRASLSA